MVPVLLTIKYLMSL